MEIHQDYKEFLSALNNNKVDYIIVGAYAMAFLGIPRNTGDIDIWVRSDQENISKLMKALDDFGLSSLGYREQDFLEPDQIIQLGVSPVRIDILMNIDGVEFNEAFQNKNVFINGNLLINYLSKEDFIKNKKASGRLKDLADIESLENIT